MTGNPTRELSYFFHLGRINQLTIIDVMQMPIAFALVAFIALSVPPARPAQAVANPSLAGVWTLDKDLSDAPPDRGERDDDARGGGRRGGGVGGSGFGRGGFGGGMGRGGARGSDPQEMARRREAMRALIEPPERLTIVETESMIVIASSDGRTTRLSPDGKKIKDENTSVERRTKWDAGKLVSEISGLGPAKIMQTLAVDPDSGQLRVTVLVEGQRGGPPRTVTHIYDATSR